MCGFTTSSIGVGCGCRPAAAPDPAHAMLPLPPSIPVADAGCTD